MLRRVQQFLDSGDSDKAREEIDRAFGNLKKVDSQVREFAALLALGSIEASEIGLGVLGRKLLQNDSEINNEVIWLFIASILSRNSIPSDSPSRISLLVLTASVNSWELPIFALLAPALDAFFKVSLADGTPLIAEQTLDFLTTWGRIYAKAPHVKTQLQELQSLSNNLLEQVDDLELKTEWSERINIFFKEASTTKYSDSNVFYAGEDLIKKIYNTQSLQRDTEDKNLAETKDKLLRLVTTENNMIKINEYTKIAVSSLSKKLDDNHPEIRAKAAESLGKIGSETAIPGLLKALEDSDEYVRRKAAEALGKIGLEEAIPALIKALSDAEDSVRFSATDAIGKIGSRYALT